MTVNVQSLEIRTSPHIKSRVTTDAIMLNVVYALLPICGFAVFAFGWSALALLAATTLTCALTEHALCRLSGVRSTVNDYSVVVTGLLLGLTLPPGFPLWMAVVGSAFAVGIGKSLFGGLGFNTFNPALVGRAFLQASFPVAITTWTPAFVPGRFSQFIPTTLTPPFLTPALKTAALNSYTASIDGWSGATPLSLMKFEKVSSDTLNLFAGMTAGSAGETCALLILIGGVYLAARKMLNWRIPVAMLGTAFVVSGLFYLADRSNPAPWFTLFSGGLMLGSVFMATDMVSSPTSPRGVWIYGALIGFLTVIIRLKGGLPEGVMYAILLGNAVAPIIDNLTQPRVFGVRKVKPQS